MSRIDTAAIRARANAASPADQWGQKWDGTLGRGEIRIGPQWAPATARFMFTAHGFGNAGTAHPDFQLAISAAADVPALLGEVDRLQGEADRVASSFMDGELDCNICGRVTANGTCTECRQGTSPLLKARAEADRLRTAITQALVQLEHIDTNGVTETLRAAMGVPEGP